MFIQSAKHLKYAWHIPGHSDMKLNQLARDMLSLCSGVCVWESAGVDCAASRRSSS